MMIPRAWAAVQAVTRVEPGVGRAEVPGRVASLVARPGCVEKGAHSHAAVIEAVLELGFGAR